MTTTFNADLQGLSAVTLADLNTRAALLDRAENKYLLSADQFQNAIVNMQNDFDLLTIDGESEFTYETMYYDTSDLQSYYQHAQGKRLRMKVRSRQYVNSGLCYFEVKLKGRRGRTIKERIPYPVEVHGTVDRTAFEFLDRCLRQHYGEASLSRLSPSLSMRFQRVTFVARSHPERVTADFGLTFTGPDGSMVEAPNPVVIVEVKSEQGKGTADQVMRDLGTRPARCSKYCIGLNLTRQDLRYNRFKQALTRHFGWTERPGLATETP